jgi:hypothetical protein
VSQPLPPRLAPLPDNAAGGSLRQHLQQQRRVSRNISPRPGALVRSGSGMKDRIASPMQPNFEPEGSYRYHFSQSTLSRAQKAKDYLELQAQYRRVLDFLPPLTPSQSRRPSTASPPGSPVALYPTSTTGSIDFSRLGRPYNPLQYIRNRKVRARGGQERCFWLRYCSWHPSHLQHSGRGCKRGARDGHTACSYGVQTKETQGGLDHRSGRHARRRLLAGTRRQQETSGG